MAIVHEIAPVEGWTLHTDPEFDSDGFHTPAYFARRGAETVEMDVSRFRFSPSQERFAFFVRNGFPKRPTPFGGWDDTEIEHAIAGERRAA